jgi:hypothetical protein
MKQEIERQIELLTQEHIRAKSFINQNMFDCTTAPFLLVKQYRDSIKQHIKVLKANLADLEE